jgi:hypothetical protein
VSPFARWRIRRGRNGYAVRLPEAERALLVDLPVQLAAALDEVTPEGEVPEELRRLFPRAHSIDNGAEDRFVTATRDDLVSLRRDALVVMSTTASRTHLSDEEADQWLGAINTLRLAIGGRLGISEETESIDEHDAVSVDWAVYRYLSFLENELVGAMVGSLPPPTAGAGDDLPEDPWGDPPGGLRWDGTPVPKPPLT